MTDAPLKRCTVCAVEKPATAEFFHAYKRSPDGRRSVCRECRAAAHAASRAEALPKRREHYRANKDRLLETTRAYYWSHADAQRESALKRYNRNRETRLVQMREYRTRHREVLLPKQRERTLADFHNRYGSNVEFTLRHRVRSLLRVTLRKGRGGARMRQVLSYDAIELKAHLERQFAPGMSWDRFMVGEIHIDHIVPVDSFRITSVESPEFRACWSLSNLRPLWARENLSKGNKVLTLL